MIGVIARRELTEYWRDGRLRWVGGLVLLLSLAALAVGWQQHRSFEAERIAAQALDYDDWLSQTSKHPHDAAHQGMHVFKPYPLLATFDAGIVAFVGSTIWLQAHRQSETKFRPAQDATGLQRFGSFTAAWVLQVLGPLLLIMMGFNAFAGERESGTLRQTLSLGITPMQLLWGKALALGVAASMVLVPVFGVTLLTVIAGPEGELKGDSLLRLLGLAAGYLLYFSTTVATVLAVSARASSSRVSLAILLGLWIAGVALAPRVAADLARWAIPSPSRLQFDAELDGDMAGAKSRMWKDEFGVASAWSPQVPLSKWGLALRLDDNVGYGVIDQHFGKLWDSFTAQQRAQELPGLVFPLLALRGYSMAMAGTDFSHHRRFANAAESQRRLMQDVISEDLVEHADTLGDQHFTYKANPDLWRRIPMFHYQPPAATQALRESIRSLAVLLVGCLLAVMLACRAVRRPLYR